MPKETFSVVKDIFTAGTHNGDVFTENDLDEMVANFKTLKDEVKVPLKIDLFRKALPPEKRHGGEPAFGWITDVKRVGNRLFAQIENIPRKLKEIIDNKGYRQVSIELQTKFKRGEENLKNVLRAVALLGVEQPGVEDLNDIWAFYTEQAGDDLKTYVVTEKEGTHMPLSPEQEADLRAQAARAATAEEELKKVKEFAGKVEGDLKTLQEKQAEADRKAAELADGQRKAGIKAFVETQKTAGKVLPRHEGLVLQVMESLTAEETLTFTKKDAEGKDVTEKVSPLVAFQRLIEDMPELVKFQEKSGAGKEGPQFTARPEDEAGTVDSQERHFKATQLIEAAKKEGKELSYREAISLVLNQKEDK